MKSTGIVRKIDPLGRIVIPKELRRTFDLKEGDPMGIYIDGDIILLKKYQVNNACMVTGDVSDRNIQYAPGLTLSPEGAEILLQKLQNEL